MRVLEAAGWIAGCGAIGGLGASVLREKGLRLPKSVGGVIQPGFIGSLFVGALAAVISWGLYGPLSNAVAVGDDITGKPAASNYGLTLVALAGAVAVGVGGSQWLTNYLDKKLLQETTGEAAAREPDSNLARRIRETSSAEQVFMLTTQLPLPSR